MELQQLIGDLSALYPGRKSFISDFVNLLTTTPPPFLHIYDPTTTSYTSKFLTETFSALKATSYGTPILFAQVSAFECLTPRFLFDRVLNELADWEPDWEGGAANWAATLGERYNDSLDGFMHGLRELVPQMTEKHGWKERPNVLLAFDDAERLKETLPTLLTPLARLSDLVSKPIGVLVNSSIIPAGQSSYYNYIPFISPMGGNPPRHRELCVSIHHQTSSSYYRRCVLWPNSEGSHSLMFRYNLSPSNTLHVCLRNL